MDNLLDEGVLPATVFCTGKTGIDSLKAVLDDADARVRDAIGKRNRVLVTLPSESARRAAHPAGSRLSGVRPRGADGVSRFHPRRRERASPPSRNASRTRSSSRLSRASADAAMARSRGDVGVPRAYFG